jgi:2-polyprenyl-3-methyl-5-hydroxy-6-metoxy-1,4-benzoquinol methylase
MGFADMSREGTVSRLTRRRLLALLGLSPTLVAQERPDEDRIWNDFLQWLKDHATPTLKPVAEYRRKLAADGLSIAELSRCEAVIQSRMLTRAEGMNLWYNKIYSSGAGVFTPSPNAFLAAVSLSLNPGDALDVAMGQGRNSIFLAQQGWSVTGFDVSDEGLAIARADAKEAGVRINAIHSGHQDFNFGRSRWDLVAMIYAFVPITSPAFVRRVVDSLRPGGAVVYEHYLYTGDPAQRAAAGWLGEVAADELPTIFRDLQVVHFEETQAVPDWGGPEPAPIARLLTKKAGRAD